MAGAVYQRRLKLAILVTFIFFLVEVAGGLISGSLSLLGDAGHMLRDVFALLLSLAAMTIAQELPTTTRTFGWHRLEILAALLNGVLLMAVSAFVMLEAYGRLLNPVAVGSLTMGLVAFAGLVVNLVVATTLHGSHDLNVQSAFLHVLGDLISSVAVIVAAVWICLTGQTFVDPLLGVAISLIILATSLPLIRETLWILLEFTPKGIDPDEVVSELLSVEGVEDIHHVHLWSLCSEINLFEAHILTEEPDLRGLDGLKREIRARLAKYGVRHSTLEFEYEKCEGAGLLEDMWGE